MYNKIGIIKKDTENGVNSYKIVKYNLLMVTDGKKYKSTDESLISHMNKGRSIKHVRIVRTDEGTQVFEIADCHEVNGEFLRTNPDGTTSNNFNQ